MADDTIVTELKVDASQFTDGMRRAIGAMGDTTAAVKKMDAGMAAANLAGGLLEKGVLALAGSFKGLAKQALEWSEDMPNDTRQVEAMSKAVGGLVDKLTLAQSAEKMQLENLRLSGKEMEAVSKWGVQMSRVWNTDVGAAMERITSVLGTGGKGLTKLLNQMGLEGKGLAELKDPVGAALDRMMTGAEGLAIGAENAKERVQELKNGITDLLGELGKNIVESGVFTNWLGQMKEGFRLLTDLIGIATGKLSLFSNAGLNALEDWARMMSVVGFFKLGREAGPGSEENAISVILKTVNKMRQVRASTPELNPDFQSKWFEQWKSIFMPETPRALEGGGGKKKTKKKKEKEWSASDYENWGEKQETEYPGFTGMSTKLKGEPGETEYPYQGGAYEQFMGSPYEQAAVKLEQINQLDREKAARLAVVDAGWKQIEMQAELDKELRDKGVSTLADFAGGLWAMADAALAGGKGLAVAMAEMVKSTLLGLASQATVKAIWHLAEGLGCEAGYAASFGAAVPLQVAAGLHFAAAAKYGIIAGVSGAIGLGMSAMGVGASSEKKKEERPEKSDPKSRPQFGTTIRENTQPIVVNVYIGDKGDPAAALYATHQITTQIRRGSMAYPLMRAA